jgi:hypothetical protein
MKVHGAEVAGLWFFNLQPLLFKAAMAKKKKS